MIYSFDISTPANTLSTAPKKTVEKVESGILVLKYIILPFGCAGLVGVSIHDANYHLWPKNPNGWFIGEGIFQFNDEFPFFDPPFTLDIYTYNEDDTYDHKPIIIIQVLRTDQVHGESEKVVLSLEAFPWEVI